MASLTNSNTPLLIKKPDEIALNSWL